MNTRYTASTHLTARSDSEHRWSWLTACLLVLTLALVFSNAQSQQPPNLQSAPDALIQKAANDVLHRIQRDQELKSGSPAKINQAIDELILPYVDFEKTTRLAVGRHWRQATPDQRIALVREFRNMLVRTYGGAVSTITPQAKVEMRPYRYPADATDVVVRTLVSDGSREPIPVDYRLEKSPKGWQIYDLNVLGVWFIENYRNQFSPIVAQSGIDGLIKALATRNEELQVPPPGP